MPPKSPPQKIDTPAAASAPHLPLTLWRGCCNAWECDHMGHMNVRFYLHRAHQAWAVFAAAIKLPNAFRIEAPSTLLPRDVHMRFHREVRAGEPLIMLGGVVSVTSETVTLYQELRKKEKDGELAATFICALTHAEAKTAKPFPWSRKSREAMGAFMIAGVPEHGAARSVFLETPAAAGDLTQAEKIGVPVLGLSALGQHECDSFGRMRPEFLIGRQSDGGGSMMDEFRKRAAAIPAPDGATAPRIGGAVLETRLAFLRWPRAGDILQMHGGLTGKTPKAVRFVNWLLDPISGECWGETESVMAHFDLERRRAYQPPDEISAILDDYMIKGLTL